MDEVNYLNWLISDTVKKHPDLKWFISNMAATSSIGRSRRQ